MEYPGSTRITSLRKRISGYFQRNRFLLSILLLGVIFYFNVLPIIAVFYSSFTAEGLTLVGDFSTDSYLKASKTLGPILVNTVLYTLGSAVLTTIIATALAWMIARTGMPGSRLYYLVLFVPFFFPPVVWENIWVRLLGVNGFYAKLLGIRTLYIESIPGMILVQSMRIVPFGLLLLTPIFGNMDRSLEEAAKMSGASTMATMRDITLPILRPGIISVFLLTTIISLESFRVPLIIGLPASIKVLPTAIYEASAVTPVDLGVAMVYGVILILLAIPLLFAYRRFLGAEEKYVTVSGSGFQTSPMDTGRLRYVFSGITFAYIAFTIIMPLLLMVYTSMVSFYANPLDFQPSMFTLEHYGRLTAASEGLVQPFINSTIAALIGATLLIFFSSVITWITLKSTLPYRDLIDYLAFVPIAIPSIALALALLYIYIAYVPIGIYGTLAILIVAFVTRYMPGTIRIVDPAVRQIHNDLLESAQVSGADAVKRIVTIVIPTIINSAKAAFSMRFAILFLELPMVIILSTSDTPMVSTALFDLQVQAEFQLMSAYGLVIMIFLGFVTLVVHGHDRIA